MCALEPTESFAPVALVYAVAAAHALLSLSLLSAHSSARVLKMHGHCRVPHGYPENKKLSWWVMNARAQFQSLVAGKKTWLTPDRIQLLNDLGFEWKPNIRSSRKKKSGDGNAENATEEGS